MYRFFKKRLGVSYASWYNWKYERRGYVFQDRFKSECVEDDAYLLTVIRYIHKNPVKAAIVNKPEQYRSISCATMEPESRNQLMRQLRYEYGLGMRQLSRVTGLALQIVRKV